MDSDKPEQLLCARMRKQKQGVTKEEERESGRVRKKQYKQGHRKVGLVRTFQLSLIFSCVSCLALYHTYLRFKQIEETQTVMQLIISSQGYKQLMFYTGHSL